MQIHRLTATLLLAAAAAACNVNTTNSGTTTPRPHVAAGIDGDRLDETQRAYLDDLLAGTEETKLGVGRKNELASMPAGQLPQFIDGEKITFCELGAKPRSKAVLISELGKERGTDTWHRQEAARRHLC